MIRAVILHLMCIRSDQAKMQSMRPLHTLKRYQSTHQRSPEEQLRRRSLWQSYKGMLQHG